MRILIVGAGATGGYFGARLAQAGRDVTFLVRERRHQQLQQFGLVLQTPESTDILRPQWLQAAELTTSFDLIILSVKSFALEQALQDIVPAVGEETLILPLLNGMRHLDLLRARFGDHRVLGGMCKIHATLGEQGEIIQLSRLHQLYFGTLDNRDDPRLAQVEEALRTPQFDLFPSADIITELWEKWLLLSTLGAVTCLARGNTQQVLRSEGGEALLQALFSEILSVITADGYRPRPAVTAGIYQWLNNPETAMTSSMYRDLTQGYRIEADQIIGDLLQRARRNGLSTPLLNAVYVNLQVYQQG